MIGLGLLLTPRLAVSLSLALIIWLPQVLTDVTSDASHTIEKRNIGVLARTGQLPSLQGKRYMASLARTGNLPLYLQKKLHPVMTHRNQEQIEPEDKRYVGTLMRSGNNPFQFHAKRDSVDAMDEDNYEKLKALEAETKALETVLYLESQLNVELLKEKLISGEVAEAEDLEEEKRSLASLARSQSMYRSGEEKRSVEALARAGYLPATPNSTAPRSDNTDTEEVGKRSVAALAKNGHLRSISSHEGKRGGIGSLARNNLLPQKKDEETRDELEALIQELILEDQEKRNIGSVARSYNTNGKRNIGSLARGGAYSKFAGKRNDFEDYAIEDDKRNVGSLLRGRLTPLQEGKRYLGSLARNQKLPYAKREFDFEEDKRTSPMALAKNWNQPENMRIYGKRYWPSAAFHNDDTEVQNVAKRYVAALLRQGPLPVGTDDNSETSERPEPDKEGGPSEEKRHLGSVKAAINKRSSDQQVGKRSKREAYMTPASDEYPMPVYQNSDLFDYDDLMEVMSGATAPQKRFLGRIPQMGRTRPKPTPASGRRRQN